MRRIECTGTHQSVATTDSPKAEGIIVKSRLSVTVLQGRRRHKGRKHNPGPREALADHRERIQARSESRDRE